MISMLIRRRCRSRAMLALLGVLALGGLMASTPSAMAEEAWPADVPGWKPVAPGEHPRLLFRKSDVPALRAKAQTPEGKAIVARLRFLLNEGLGETLPTVYSPATQGYSLGNRQNLVLQDVAAFSIGHAAGYGMLYQLTGDKKFAELGRQCFEKMMQGVRDRDDRYSFERPNGELRAGPSWGIAALGYDLCYDGWDEATRRRIAAKFLEVTIENSKEGLKKIALRPKYGPAKNHTGGIVGGAGVACAALYGDPGVENEPILQEWLPAVYQNTLGMLTRGFGDHGFYSEGQGPSHVSSNTIFTTWLRVAKVACGKDFISPRPNAQWITMRWAMELTPLGGKPQYPSRPTNGGPSYGTDDFWRDGMSHGGQFAQGFGAVLPEQAPALLWVYRAFVEPFEHKSLGNQIKDTAEWLPANQKSYDSIVYPHNAVQALVNWPVGVAPVNPEKVLPKAMEDRVHGYYVFRNRWKDADDVIVTALLGYGPKDAYKPEAGPVYVWGLGQKMKFGSFRTKSPAEFQARADGSGTIVGEGKCLAVDFSGASGAELLVATLGIEVAKPKKGTAAMVPLGDVTVGVFVLSSKAVPEPVVRGNTIVVGGQTISVVDGRIVLAK